MKVFAFVITIVLVILYPVGIGVGLSAFGARTVGLWILLVLVPVALLRFRKAAREDLVAVMRVPLVILGVVLLGVITDDARFVLAMPVLINLALLATFAASLAGTPMIERFARMKNEDGLSDAQMRHCRQITWVWTAFFAINASIAAGLALFAPLAWWTVYNAGIAYGLMGLLFAGEYVLRQYRFRKYGSGLHDRLLSRIFPPLTSEP